MREATVTARIVLPGLLRDLTGGVSEVPADVPAGGADLATVLDDGLRSWPLVQSRIRDERGRIRRHVNIFVDGEDVKRGDGTRTRVAPGAVIHIVNAVSGG